MSKMNFLDDGLQAWDWARCVAPGAAVLAEHLAKNMPRERLDQVVADLKQLLAWLEPLAAAKRHDAAGRAEHDRIMEAAVADPSLLAPGGAQAFACAAVGRAEASTARPWLGPPAGWGRLPIATSFWRCASSDSPVSFFHAYPVSCQTGRK